MSEASTQFALQRIYVRDLSFESPRAPDVFRGNWKPQVKLDISTRHQDLGEQNYEVVLSVTATVSSKNEEAADGQAEEGTLYLVEVQQAGVFLIQGPEGDDLERLLGSFCPNLLFPYARELVDSLVSRGSFPPLMLAPVNFDGIYDQVKAQRDASKKTH